ncbi:hypothetical protein M3Y94_00461000 [Aphelenchoides besseyi]|nr:hypothetical protein M3Y94_00461000 [Aphelenchoides besseyi]KAI6229216.1 hypothetical protein M3Y95_00507900 [Aphelenchoides besseyi]
MAANISWEPVIALKNLKPFDCFVEYKQGKKDELMQCGDEQFLTDYVGKIIKWYTRMLSRPEIVKYQVPNLELPRYAVIHNELSSPKVQNKNEELIAMKNYLINTSRSATALKKTAAYFKMRDEEFAYERRVTNRRQELAQTLKKVINEHGVKTINDNQFLLYHRAWNIWKLIQKQAQENGDVRITTNVTQDPETMFPIRKFSQILVDTPPLPALGTFERYQSDVEKFKAIVAERNPKLLTDKQDHEMIVVPSMRYVFFDEPPKWRKLGRRSPCYP